MNARIKQSNFDTQKRGGQLSWLIAQLGCDNNTRALVNASLNPKFKPSESTMVMVYCRCKC